MNIQSLDKQEFYIQIKQIKTKKCSFRTKIKLMEGLLNRLKSYDNNPQLTSLYLNNNVSIYNSPQPKSMNNIHKGCYSQNQSTSYSFFSDSPQTISGYQAASQFEELIMQKRVVKFQINQEIEILEDDLFELDKVVETKRDLNDELAKRIQKRMKEIGSNIKSNKQDNVSSQNIFGIKSNKKQQSKDLLNCTISGASGFGFQSNRNIGANNNLNISKNEILMSHVNVESQVQRKKAKSHYLNKSIGAVTGIFKNILK